MKLAFASVLILVFSVTAALGQTASARINGRVSDGTGAVIPGVAVKVTNVDTNIAQTATSTETGDFTILYLPPGRYQLQATAQGFRTYKQSDFPLALDQGLRLDIKLEVGATTESVTVFRGRRVIGRCRWRFASNSKQKAVQGVSVSWGPER